MSERPTAQELIDEEPPKVLTARDLLDCAKEMIGLLNGLPKYKPTPTGIIATAQFFATLAVVQAILERKEK